MSDVHVGVGSYVVDALDTDERADFERHLATCETCEREVTELNETVSELGHLTVASPPPNLRASVLGAIREVRPLPPIGVTAPLGGPATAEATPAAPAAAGSAATSPAVIDELAVRRERRSRRWLSAAVAAALVAVLALGGWVYTLNEQRQAQVAQEQTAAAQTQAQIELLSAPDVKVVSTRLRDGGQASFTVSKSLNRALFSTVDLPSPGPNLTYQLWTIISTEDIRPDVLVPGGTLQVFLTGNVRDAAQLGVTIEPAGGSATPTMTQLQGSPAI